MNMQALSIFYFTHKNKWCQIPYQTPLLHSDILQFPYLEPI